MINEDQALALLDEVNPVPDMNAYEVSEADIAAHLKTLIERSSEMTQLDSNPTTKRRSRPAGWWIAAAAMVVVLGAAVVLMTRGPSERDAAAPPTPTTVLEPTPITAEVVIDTLVEDLENGTFVASGDLFECEGRWRSPEMHLNEGDAWWFDTDYVCNDGSGTLLIRTEGDGPEPEPGDSVGTWTVVSGSGAYEGFTGEGTYALMINPWTERLEGKLASG